MQKQRVVWCWRFLYALGSYNSRWLFLGWGNNERKNHLIVFWAAINSAHNGIRARCIKHDSLLLNLARDNHHDWIPRDLERMHYIHTGGNQCDSAVLRDGDAGRCITGLADIKKPLFGDDAQNIVLWCGRNQAELAKFALIESHWIDGTIRWRCPYELNRNTCEE